MEHCVTRKCFSYIIGSKRVRVWGGQGVEGGVGGADCITVIMSVSSHKCGSINVCVSASV